MRNKILLIATLITGSLSAQFDASNAPALGDSIRLYIVDSTATDYANITGDGVTWDYSNLIDYNGESRLIDVKSPQQTAHNVTFVNSDLAIETEGEIIAFITDDANERVSQGLVFNDADNGDLILTLEANEGLYYTYPFDFGDEITDSIKGTATFTFMNQLMNAPARGKVRTKVDGRGTLNMGLTGVYTNVLRYNITDTMVITTPVADFTVIHNQYEYYDHTVSSLPIFTHTSMWFGQIGGTVLRDFNFVLSKDIITTSLSQEVLAETKLYPNPTSQLLNIELPNGINKASISIVDAVGRIVMDVNIEDTFANLNVSHLKEGAYFVKIASDNTVVTKTLILK